MVFLHLQQQAKHSQMTRISKNFEKREVIEKENINLGEKKKD